MANIVGYAYKGKIYTPLGMKALLIKTNRIPRRRFEPPYTGYEAPAREPRIQDVISWFITLCGRDMDAPDTYDSADLPKPVFDDEATEEEQAMFLSTRHVQAMVIHQHGMCPGCNPPSDEEVMRRNDGKIPARIVARVWHDSVNPEFPWFYTVDAYPMHDPQAGPAFIDYGSVETAEQAWGCVAHVLTHRGECDNPEYQHVRADKR